MGFAISWLAVRTDAPESLLSSLGLTRTGKEDELFETPLSGGPLKGGWYLIVANDCAHRIVEETALAALSRAYELVACSVEEHVMVSTAASWRSGELAWRIVHDSSRGIFDLDVSGTPPQTLEHHKERGLAQQEAAGGRDADVDYLFDVPLEVAKGLTGFKHDEVTDCHMHPLEALEERRRLQ